jgi:hypothetical protein
MDDCHFGCIKTFLKKNLKKKKKKNSNLSSYGTLEFETRILIITKMV